MTTDEGRVWYGKPLTWCERKVCDLLCIGLNNKETAAKLGISSRTVEDHRKHIFRKYGVRNAVELVRAVYGIKEFGPQQRTLEPAE